jgi:serine/threonine protein kinase
MAGPGGGGQASGPSPRELDLRLGRRALAKKLLAGPALSEALLEMVARKAPLGDVLAKKGLVAPDQVAALKAEIDSKTPAEGFEEAPSKEDPRVGQILLAVKCDARIEQQKFMTTYAGRLPRDPEPAALLLISTDAIRNGLWVDFLETERAMKGLQLPGIVPVLDCGRVEGNFAIVTRHRQGTLNLRTLLDRIHRLKLSEALRIAREAAQGLVALHEKGLVHRDVTPSNIVLGRDGAVQVRRAGIVFEPEGAQAFAARGSVFGSPHTIAPECLRGEGQDPANDVYSLGVVTYEMVTGVRPFEGETIADLRPQVLEQPPLRPDKFMKDVPDNVSELLTWMLSKKPKDRPLGAKLVNVIQTLERNIHRSGETQRFQAHG